MNERLHFGYDPYNSHDAWREWSWIMESMYRGLDHSLAEDEG